MEEKDELIKSQEKSLSEEVEVVSGKGKIVAVVSGIILVVLAVCFISFCLYYRNRWYPGTTIAEIEVSGKTIEESKQYVLDQFKGYTLTVNGRDGRTLTISDSDIDFVVSAGADWEETFSSQHEESIVPIGSSGSYESALEVSYDEKALEKILKSSEIVKGSENSPVQKPVSAKVVFSKKKDQYICEPEIQGNEVDRETFISVVKETLSKCETKIDIDDAEQYPEVYKAPEVTSEDEGLKEQVTKCNNVVLRYITWKMAKGVKEKITPKMISEWIEYSDGKVNYKKKKIEKWVETFCKKYETVGATRTLKTHDGKKVKVAGGDYGWQMDHAKTLTQVKKALSKKIAKKDINAYIKEQSSENKKALTLLRTPVYLNTAYQYNQENPTQDWDTKNYVEVSLAEQMVYVIRKGKVKFSCRCISGRPVPGRQTRTGCFYLKEHLPEHTMVGADYRTHVRYWVRITWTGTGFHPATWQPWSRWSPTLYQTRGSHGCINLSPTDAVTIYNLTKYREAVFLH